MNKIKLLPKKIWMLSLMAILATGLSVTTGCQSEEIAVKEDGVINDHVIDINPVPLTEEEKNLSLVGYGAKGALTDQDLTIADMLMYAIQDEYLAHKEYQTIIIEFGSITPYANIVKAEASHIGALTAIYDAYSINLPADDSEDHMIVPASLLEAAQTGVAAEIDNINMYKSFLSYDLPEDIKTVFESLMKASESHLAAFEKQVDKLS